MNGKNESKNYQSIWHYSWISWNGIKKGKIFFNGRDLLEYDFFLKLHAV